MTRSELAIVGAGPAAAAAARAAARHGIETLVVAPVAPSRAGVLELVGAAAAPALQVLRVADAVRAVAHPLARTEFRWGRDDPGAQSHDPGTSSVVDRDVLDGTLLTAAQESGARRLELLVTGCAPTPSGGWALSTSDALGRPGPPVEARRVLVATGRGSRLAQRMGGARRSRHPMVAVIRRLEGSHGVAGVMRVDPTPNGWWYAMGDDRRAIVGFVTDADLLAPGRDRAVATWDRERGGRSWIPASAGAELRRAAVSEASGLPDGIRAIGDAALAVDPLSGHGLRVALESGLRAVIAPDGYDEWLAEERRRHRDAERRLYRAESRFADQPFWRRRTS